MYVLIHTYLIGMMQLHFWEETTIWSYFTTKFKCKFKDLFFFFFPSVISFNVVFIKNGQRYILLFLTENITIPSHLPLNFKKILSQRYSKLQMTEQVT